MSDKKWNSAPQPNCGNVVSGDKLEWTKVKKSKVKLCIRVLEGADSWPKAFPLLEPPHPLNGTLHSATEHHGTSMSNALKQSKHKCRYYYEQKQSSELAFSVSLSKHIWLFFFLFGREGLKSTNLKAVAQLCERVNLVLASVLASVFKNTHPISDKQLGHKTL